MKTVYLVRDKRLKECVKFNTISDAANFCSKQQQKGYISCYIEKHFDIRGKYGN